MHQFKITAKMAFRRRTSAVAPGLRHLKKRRPDARGSGRMKRPRSSLTRSTSFNGPLIAHSGSHQAGLIEADHDTSTTSYPPVTIQPRHDQKARRARRHRAPQGPPGSMILFTPAWCTLPFPTSSPGIESAST